MKTFQQEFNDTHGYIYHHKCYSNYTNIKPVGNSGSENVWEDAESEKGIDRERLWQTKSAAFIVGTNRKKGEAVLKNCRCLTKTAAESLQMYISKHDDNPQHQADVTEVGREVIVARELLYHHSCYRDYTKRTIFTKLDCD